MFKYLGAAFAGALMMVATTASAVPLPFITGGLNVVGAMTPSDDPFVPGSTATLGPAGTVENPIGDFTLIFPLTPYDLTSVTIEFTTGFANQGVTFTIDEFTFELFRTETVSVAMLPFGLATGNGTVSAAGFADTGFTWALAANNLQDGYTLGITSTEDVPPVPVPAALPLLAGAIGVLGLIRRRA